jgi:hypothetical protein
LALASDARVNVTARLNCRARFSTHSPRATRHTRHTPVAPERIHRLIA